MASTYVNDLRLEEMATGDQSGTWGDTTNTNLELIAEAFSYGTEASFGSDADATTTIADGATDPARSLYLKVTSGASLTATRTLTIAPNTVSKIWIIENATSGSQSINISQGSGANVTIPNGDVKVVYSDGAGSGAAVVDAFTDLNLSGTTTVAALDAGSGAITTTGTVTGGTLAGTLSTAAQPNITSVGTLTGLGVNSGAAHLNVSFATSNAAGYDSSLFLTAGASGGVSVLNLGYDGDTDYSRILRSGTNLIFNNNNTERMRIDSSGNCGIGTTSPTDFGSGFKTLQVTSANTTSGGVFRSTNSDSSIVTQLNTNSTGGFVGTTTSHPLVFGTANLERMRIDSSGNVGIGVSSISTQGQLYIGASGTSTDAKIALSPTNSSGGQNPLAQIGSTADGTYGSELYFTTRSTGATVSEAMRIDSSGNVGIGTSSIASGGANTQNVQIHNSTANSTYLKLSTSGTGATASDGLDLIMGNDGTAYVWNRENSNTIFATNNQERLRIDGSGNLLVGGTSSGGSGKVQAQVGFDAQDGSFTTSIAIRNYSSAANSGSILVDPDNLGASSVMYFGIDGVAPAKMKLDSAGRLNINQVDTLFGTGALNITGEVGASFNAIQFRHNASTIVGTVVTTASSTAYNTSSDYRLKENVDYTWDATTRLKQLKPARFNFITDDTNTLVDGFLAHEVQDIVPEAITGEKDAMMDEEYEITPAVKNADGIVVTEAVMGTHSVPDYQSIDQSKLVPLLVKTIQELEARITALES